MHRIPSWWRNSSRKFIINYCAQLFAESTKTTYKTHRDTYLCFCMYMGHCPVPVQPGHLLQYAAFLACTLKASSVRSYLNIIGILHKEFGLTNPLLNNWPLKSLLMGINRSKGLTPNQKQPITPALLQQLHSTLDLTTGQVASFWAICLVAFYGMFLKSHLLPTVPHLFNSKQQLTKGDFTIYPWGQLLLSDGGKLSNFAKGSSRFLFHSFVTKWCYHLSTLGLDPRSYAGHSFRRGEHHLRTNLASLLN